MELNAVKKSCRKETAGSSELVRVSDERGGCAGHPDGDMTGCRSLVTAEVFYPGWFSRMFVTQFGLMFHNVDFPAFREGNHAVITGSGHDIFQCIHAVEMFYEKRGLAAVFRSSLNGERDVLVEAGLAAAGYQVCPERTSLAVCGERCLKKGATKSVRVGREVTPGIREFLSSDEARSWIFEKIRRRAGARKFYIITAEQNGCVSALATYHDMGNLCRLDDLTIPEGKEDEGAGLLRYITVFHNQRCDKPLYAVTGDEISGLYFCNGYHSARLFPRRWSAQRSD